jgi:5S rRNA maturation endonuclease (ribonuclease M5)
LVKKIITKKAGNKKLPAFLSNKGTMYQYNSSSVSLNKSEILKRVSQEEIFKLVFQYYPTTDTYVVSPFRNDKTPGCFFEYYNETLYFKDFANKIMLRNNIDCFEAVKIHFKLKNFNDTLVYIDKTFKLGIKEGNPIEPRLDLLLGNNTNNKLKSNFNKSTKNKNIMSIETLYREFNILDRKYWFDRYGISKKNLIDDNTFPVRKCKYFSEKQKKEIIYVPISIAYCFNLENNFKKIYSPFFANFKWITNCNNNCVGNIDNLPIYGYELVITKSYKDARVLRNFGLRNVVWFSSENQFPNDNILLDLLNRFEKITVWFDNDNTGKTYSKLLVEKLNELNNQKEKRIIITENYKGKDISDIRYLEGEKKTETLLKSLF